MADSIPGHPEIALILAPNPGPMTGRGTNTYLLGEESCVVIDPGPAIDSHLEAIRSEAERRGGLAGILLTHSHADHDEAVPALDAPLLWPPPRSSVEEDPDRVGTGGGPVGAELGLTTPGGPLTVLATPGHAVDHACFLAGEVAFCGDLVLGEGSSIVLPRVGGGSLTDYMGSLDALDERRPRLMLPGHGPAIAEPAVRIADYREHRLMRERRLVAALESGDRSRARLLDAAWADVPEQMRPAADVALQAHLEKLADDGRLPDGIEPLAWSPAPGELQA